MKPLKSKISLVRDSRIRHHVDSRIDMMIYFHVRSRVWVDQIETQILAQIKETIK